MKRALMTLLSLILFCTLFLYGQETSNPKPPVARVENVVTEYFGIKVNDPYRYMENLDDPYVQKWIKAQADYAANILTNLPRRQELLDRLVELDAGQPFKTYGFRLQKDGSIFYMKRNSDENLYKIYMRDQNGNEKLLVDPETVPAEEGEHYSIERYTPSSKGDYLIYGLAKSGSEEAVFHILNVVTGEHLPETIDRIETAYNRPHWLPDGSGFFYSRRRLLPKDAPETEIYKKTKIFFHRLNTPVEQDQLIAGIGLSDRMVLGEVDFPSMYIPPKSDQAVVKIKHGDANELTLYTAPIKTLLKKISRGKKYAMSKTR